VNRGAEVRGSVRTAPGGGDQSEVDVTETQSAVGGGDVGAAVAPGSAQRIAEERGEVPDTYPAVTWMEACGGATGPPLAQTRMLYVCPGVRVVSTTELVVGVSRTNTDPFSSTASTV